MRHAFTRFDPDAKDHYVLGASTSRQGWYLYVGSHNGRRYYRHCPNLFAKPHGRDAARMRGLGMRGQTDVTYDVPFYPGTGRYAPDRDNQGYIAYEAPSFLTGDVDTRVVPDELRDYKARVRQQLVADLSRTPSPEELRKVNGKLMALGLLPVEESYKVVTVEVRVKLNPLHGDDSARRTALSMVTDAVGSWTAVAEKVVTVEAQGVERKGGQ